MTLHMIQLAPDMARLTRWAAERDLMARRGEAELGYALHAALLAGFADMAPRPFALLCPARGPASLLGYSPNDAAVLRAQAAAFAEPEICAALGMDRLAGKTMPPGFEAGRRLGFMTRIRPTVRTDRDGDRDLTVEKDAFLLSPQGSDRGAVYAEWLGARLAAGGARVMRASLDVYRRTQVLRRGADRRLRASEGPDATFSGALEVVDRDAFAVLLARGVGRHRAFGFGMLLLRPA